MPGHLPSDKYFPIPRALSPVATGKGKVTTKDDISYLSPFAGINPTTQGTSLLMAVESAVVVAAVNGSRRPCRPCSVLVKWSRLGSCPCCRRRQELTPARANVCCHVVLLIRTKGNENGLLSLSERVWSSQAQAGRKDNPFLLPT